MKPRKVLIIDDEADICFLLGKVLKEMEFEVHIASDLKSGFDATERIRPGIIFLDIRLPDGSGLEAIGDIKMKSPETRVVIMSAYDGFTEQKEAKAKGADLFVSKPINRTKLVLDIKDYLAD